MAQAAVAMSTTKRSSDNKSKAVSKTATTTVRSSRKGRPRGHAGLDSGATVRVVRHVRGGKKKRKSRRKSKKRHSRKHKRRTLKHKRRSRKHKRRSRKR